MRHVGAGSGLCSHGTSLEATSTVKFVVPLAGLLLAGCPSAQSPGDPAPDAGAPGDAGLDAGISPALECPTRLAACTTTLAYRGAASSVSLRGDFAPDGWSRGVDMVRAPDGAWSATIPVADQQVIAYKLVVDGTWRADPANPRTSPDGFGGLNSVVRVDCDGCPARPAIDWRDAVLYFVLLDRFANGDPSNDAPVDGVSSPAQFQGGDLAGLRAAIESGYFRDLGVTALWLSSPLDNAEGRNPGADGFDYAGYHGYWPTDLDAVEEHVGSEAELRELVAVAHRHGLQVLIDYVMNHVHADSPVYRDHPGWFWPNDNGAGGDCQCGRGCDWNSARLRCWFDPFLPDFDFRNDDARRFSVDNAVAWARRLGVDGFRLDAVKHVETAWLTDLRARIDGEVAWDQSFYLVGETFEGDRALIKEYVDPKTKLDGQFDFPLRAELLRVLLRRQGTMGDLAHFLDSNDGYYGPGAVMSTFLGNHDVPRVVHLAEDQPLWGEWDGGKERGWRDQPALPTSSRPFERLAVAYTMLFTLPGVPLLYYGDEVGMPGAGDPDNRRFMQWGGYSDPQRALRTRIAALAKLRAARPALRRGTRRTLGASRDVYVYEMTAPRDAVVVVMNRGDDAGQAVGLPAGEYADLVTGAVRRAPLSVPPRTAYVLEAR
jgi:glycosidase